MLVASAAGGLLLGAALAKAVAPHDYFSWPCSFFVPWALYVNRDSLPAHLKLPAAVAAGAVFIGYNFTRKSRFCD